MNDFLLCILYIGISTRREPELVKELANKKAVQIACGSTYSAAVTSNGELYTWGRGSYGRLGHGNIFNLSLKEDF